MKTLTRYALKKSIKPFLMGLAGFIVFVSVEYLYQLSDYIVRNKVGIRTLLILMGYNIPYFTVLGIPVGVLFAIFWVLSELSTNREITAALVHGIPSRYFVTPFLILGVMCAIGSFFLNDYIVPKANYKASQMLVNYIFQNPQEYIRTNVLTQLQHDLYFFVKEYNEQSGELKDIVLFRNEEGNEQILTAETVTKKSDGWYLLKGKMYIVETDTGFLKLDMLFDEMKLDITGEIHELIKTGKSTRDLTSTELRQRIQTYEKIGIKPSNLIVELQQRYANIIGAIVIVLIGVPLSLLFGLQSRSWSVLLTFLIIVLYQGSGAWLSALGKEGYIDPVLAAWLPNIVYLIVGLVLYLLLDTYLVYRVREILSKFFVILVILVLLSSPTKVFGAESKALLSALNVEYSKNAITLTGNVTVKWDDKYLVGESAEIFVEDGYLRKVVIKGKTTYFDGTRTYNADELTYIFSEKRAFAIDVRTKYEYDYKGKKVPIYVGTDEMEVNTENENVFGTDAYVTTCDLADPHYEIRSKNITVLEGKYIIIENSLLFVLDFPFLPYPLFILALDGSAPYSFSFSFSDRIDVTNTFRFNINSWNTTLAISSENLLLNSVNDKNKVVLDTSKSLFELNIQPFTLRNDFSNNTLNFRYNDGLYVFDGIYNSENNYLYRLLINYISTVGGSSFAFQPNLSYNSVHDTSIFGITYSMRNIMVPLSDYTNLSINSVNSNISLSQKGVFDFGENFTKSSYSSSYNITLTIPDLKVRTEFTGNLTDKLAGNTIRYALNYPFSITFSNFTFSTNYTFNANVVNTIKYDENVNTVLGLKDVFSMSLNVNYGPFTIGGTYEGVFSYLSEPTATDRSNVKFTFSNVGSGINTTFIRTYDLKKPEPLSKDEYKISTQQKISNLYDFRLTYSSGFDYLKNELAPGTFSLQIGYIPYKVYYGISFNLTPIGSGLEYQKVNPLIHTITCDRLTGTIYQDVDFIRRIIVSGSFDLLDYKGNLRYDRLQQTKDSDSKVSLTASLEKKNEKYTLAYNVDGKEKITMFLENNNFEPKFSVGFTYDPKNSQFINLNVKTIFNLHCWLLETEIVGSYKGTYDIWSYLDKIIVKFTLTDIPDLFFKTDVKNGGFETGSVQ